MSETSTQDPEVQPLRIGRLEPAILCLVTRLQAQTPAPDPAGVLNRFAIARFRGSGTESIQALASDATGNLYVAGSTTSPDFPVKNAAQPLMGEGVLMRSNDGGVTWRKVHAWSNPSRPNLRRKEPQRSGRERAHARRGPSLEDTTCEAALAMWAMPSSSCTVAARR